MLVIYKTEPILHTDGIFGMHRDRIPDAGWSELRSSRLEGKVEDLPATPELLQILLEDLAYAYGENSTKFIEKLREFNLTVIQK